MSNVTEMPIHKDKTSAEMKPTKYRIHMTAEDIDPVIKHLEALKNCTVQTQTRNAVSTYSLHEPDAIEALRLALYRLINQMKLDVGVEEFSNDESAVIEKLLRNLQISNPLDDCSYRELRALAVLKHYADRDKSADLQSTYDYLFTRLVGKIAAA